MKARLTRNSLWMILSRFSAQGLSILFTVMLARRLGTAGFGAFAFIAAVLFVTNALTTFGTDMHLIREIAAQDDLSGLPFALTVQLVLSTIVIVIVWLFAARIPNQSRETILALKIYSLALVPLAFFTVFTIALRGKQLMDAYALLNILVSVLQVGAVLMLREKNLALLSSFLLSVQVVVAIVAGMICVMLIPNFARVSQFGFIHHFEALGRASFSSFLKACAPIALLTLLTMLYQRLSISMLSLMTNPSDTGIFSAAARILEASKTVHIAVFASLYPAMAQVVSFREFDGRVSGSRDVPSELLNRRCIKTEAVKYLWILLLGATLISLSLFAFANPLVTLLYGNEFLASINVLQIFVWMLVPFTVNTYLTLSFLASKQERQIRHALTAGLLGLLIMNLWWIPLKGPQGSAWASLIAECIQSVALLVGARPYVRVQGEVHEFSELS